VAIQPPDLIVVQNPAERVETLILQASEALVVLHVDIIIREGRERSKEKTRENA
jgi:hypothetical protein